MAFSGTTAGSQYVPAAGITEVIADGRYIQLAPSAVQTGASPYIQLGSGKTLKVVDSSGNALIDMNDGAASYVRASSAQNLVLGSATGVTETNNVVLDNGSGFAIMYGLRATSGGSCILGTNSGAEIFALLDSGTPNLRFRGINTAANGWAPIYANGAEVALSTSAVTICSYTNGAADGTFTIGGYLYLSAFTGTNIALQVTYTNEANSVVTVSFSQGSISLFTGAGTYPLSTMTIRVKASTTITIATAVNATAVTGTASAHIEQVA